MHKCNICICIPTYKRPQLLDRLLRFIEQQHTHNIFTLSVVVVDNDNEKTAQKIVAKYHNRLSIVYQQEPVQNISLARNRALRSAKGEYAAFIDDDEFPDFEWLYNHLLLIKKTGADGILGPVKPHFEIGAPEWLKKSGVCVRPSFPTATKLHAEQTRTGNVLLDIRKIRKHGLYFDPAFGLSGGEDRDFFRRAIAAGLTFLWCDQAVVYETVPPERWSRCFYLKRAFLRGSASHHGLKKLNTMQETTVLLKSLIAFCAYSIAFPIVLPLGERFWMGVSDRYFNHMGRLTAAAGIHVFDRR